MSLGKSQLQIYLGLVKSSRTLTAMGTTALGSQQASHSPELPRKRVFLHHQAIRVKEETCQGTQGWAWQSQLVFSLLFCILFHRGDHG